MRHTFGVPTQLKVSQSPLRLLRSYGATPLSYACRFSLKQAVSRLLRIKRNPIFKEALTNFSLNSEASTEEASATRASTAAADTNPFQQKTNASKSLHTRNARPRENTSAERALWLEALACQKRASRCSAPSFRPPSFRLPRPTDTPHPLCARWLPADSRGTPVAS